MNRILPFLLLTVLFVSLSSEPTTALDQPLSKGSARTTGGAAEVSLDLHWKSGETSESKTSEDGIFGFTYDPVDGFRDFDFHPIETPEAWKTMKAKSRNSVATLLVSPALSLTDLNRAIKEITTKGGFQEIRVSVRSHR